MEDYLALVLRFDESFTSAEMAFLPLRHQRRQKFNPNSQFLNFQRLESRAAKERVVPGQSVGTIMAWWAGRWSQCYCWIFVGNSEILSDFSAP